MPDWAHMILETFSFKKMEDISPFCGAIDTPILDFWWHLPWVSKSKWIPFLHASSPMCNGILRFTFDVITADLLAASMAAKSFQSTSIGGLESDTIDPIYRAAASQCDIWNLPLRGTKLSRSRRWWHRWTLGRATVHRCARTPRYPSSTRPASTQPMRCRIVVL